MVSTVDHYSTLRKVSIMLSEVNQQKMDDYRGTTLNASYKDIQGNSKSPKAKETKNWSSISFLLVMRGGTTGKGCGNKTI